MGGRSRLPLLAVAPAALLLGSACAPTATPPAPRATPTPTATPVPPAAPSPRPSATPSGAPSPSPPTLSGPATVHASAYAALADGSVVPLDPGSGMAGPAIPTGHPSPRMVTAPGGSTAYLGVVGALLPVDLSTQRVGNPIPLPVAEAPIALAITPDGRTACVALEVAAGTSTPSSPQAYVYPVDLSTGRVGTRIPVSGDPYAIAITPDGRTAYVVDGGTGALTPVDLIGGSAETPIPLAVQPDAVAITANGSTAWVLSAGPHDGSLEAVTLSPNPGQGRVAGTVTAAALAGATTLALTADGTSAFAAGPDGAAQLALPGGAVVWQAPPAGYTGVALSPDGGTALLAGNNLTEGGASGVLVVDVGTDQATGTIVLDGPPVSIVFGPSG